MLRTESKKPSEKGRMKNRKKSGPYHWHWILNMKIPLYFINNRFFQMLVSDDHNWISNHGTK